MNPAVRTILILLVLAALVAVVPGGGSGADTTIQGIQIAFLGAVGLFVSVMYREHRLSLYALGDARRTALYVSVAVAAVTIFARQRMWDTTTGKVAWVALLLGSIYAAFTVVWSARRN